MSSSPSQYEPDSWTLLVRKDWERAPKMLELLSIRSDAAKKAAADESTEYSGLFEGADLGARTALQARAAAAQQAYEAECNANRDWLARQAPENGVPEDHDEGVPLSSDQNVVPLKRQVRITSVPQPSYVSLPWSDAITENMECVDRIARALEEENGGKRSKRHEKLLLRKYFEALGSPKAGSIGRSGYPEHIEKRVNRYLWLEQAFESGKIVYPKGYPIPFSMDEQQTLQDKLRALGVPKDGIQQLINSVRKFVKRRSKRPQRH
jgi:hypothetical protein